MWEMARGIARTPAPITEKADRQTINPAGAIRQSNSLVLTRLITLLAQLAWP